MLLSELRLATHAAVRAVVACVAVAEVPVRERCFLTGELAGVAPQADLGPDEYIMISPGRTAPSSRDLDRIDSGSPPGSSPSSGRISFLLTGMRPEEMFVELGNAWSVEADGIRIHGPKSPAADRVVPRIGILVKPSTGRLAFYRALRKASSNTVSPYDLRRSYAQWLDLARIPQFRQDYYMAHGPKDLNALYKRMREVSAYLQEDGAALGRLVGEPVMVRMMK